MPINSGSQQGSGASAMGLMQMIQGMSGSGKSKSSVPAVGEDSSAMSRRMDTASQDPSMLLNQGIQHADNPDVPLDYETRLAVMQPLLEAKHFGQGGQGQVKSGKNEGSGQGLSSVIGAVAALA